MAESESHWKRDIVVIPLVVGIALAAFSFGFPKLFEKGKRITYVIDGPNAYLNPKAVGNVKITADGVPVANLFGYRVRVWNSGDAPLKQLPIRFAFDTTNSNFRVLNVQHDTIPQKEFGHVDEQGSDSISKRFIYELLNPNDEDTLTFLTSAGVPLTLYAKAEGLELKQEATAKPDTKSSNLQALIVGLASFLASLASLWIERNVRKRAKRASSVISSRSPTEASDKK